MTKAKDTIKSYSKVFIEEFIGDFKCERCGDDASGIGGVLSFDDTKIKMCNSCFIEIQLSIKFFLKEKEQVYGIPNFCIEKIKKQNANTSNYILKIHSYVIEINAAQLKFLRSILNQYNKFQYETCGIDLDEQDIAVRELINQWKAPLKKVEENREKLKAQCEELVYRTEEANDDLPEPKSTILHSTITAYCSIDDVFCTVIDTSDKAKLLLITNQDSLFNFAFSINRAYDLAEILLKFYINEKINFSQNRTVKIKKQNSSKNCLICGNKESFEYLISFGNKNFSLCKTCFQKLINVVLNSSISKELFSNLYEEYEVKRQKQKTKSLQKKKGNVELIQQIEEKDKKIEILVQELKGIKGKINRQNNYIEQAENKIRNQKKQLKHLTEKSNNVKNIAI